MMEHPRRPWRHLFQILATIGCWLGIPPNRGEFSKGFLSPKMPGENFEFLRKICTVLASQLLLFPYNRN